ALVDEIASGQYALAAIAANLLALSGFSEEFLDVSVLTTSDISVPPLTLSHTHLAAATAAAGSEYVMPAAFSEAMNASSVLSACAGTAMPMMAARLVMVRSNFIALLIVAEWRSARISCLPRQPRRASQRHKTGAHRCAGSTGRCRLGHRTLPRHCVR